MISKLFYLGLILLGIPTGLLLTRLCDDEIQKWTKKLKLTIITATILILILTFNNFKYKLPSIISLLFIITTNIIIIGVALSEKRRTPTLK